MKQLTIDQETYECIRDTAIWVGLAPKKVHAAAFDEVLPILMELATDAIDDGSIEVKNVQWESGKVIVYFYDGEPIELIV